MQGEAIAVGIGHECSEARRKLHHFRYGYVPFRKSRAHRRNVVDFECCRKLRPRRADRFGVNGEGGVTNIKFDHRVAERCTGRQADRITIKWALLNFEWVTCRRDPQEERRR